MTDDAYSGEMIDFKTICAHLLFHTLMINVRIGV